MVRPIRTTRVDVPERIKEVARRQMAEQGASSLSLRAIAREVGITAPAIYNYYPDRDALVTALIIDAFASFGEELKISIEKLPRKDHRLRLSMLGLAYRQWAITHPEQYQLIFGTPIPGYHAPVEHTQPVAAKALGALIDVLSAASEDGKLRFDPSGRLSPQMNRLFKSWHSDRGKVAPLVLYLTVAIWSRVHGLVSMEIGEQFPPFVGDAKEYYACEIKNLINHYIGE